MWKEDLLKVGLKLSVGINMLHKASVGNGGKGATRRMLVEINKNKERPKYEEMRIMFFEVS